MTLTWWFRSEKSIMVQNLRRSVIFGHFTIGMLLDYI